jgi:hypothetical protein
MTQLKEQLQAVGEELLLERDRNTQLSKSLNKLTGIDTESSDVSAYKKRELLYILPRILPLLAKDDRFVVVDAG